MKFKRKMKFGVLVLLQQQIITAHFRPMSLMAYYLIINALLQELNRAV
jgi:hypothetical protein